MKKARILIVDGDPDFSQMTKQAIEQAGYESVCAINGRTGLDMAKRERPALIILEVILPDINGFSVCRELKEDPACQAIPVVLYTNLGTKTGSYAEHIGMEHGADAYVEKPAAPQALLEKVSTLLAPTRPVQGEERGRKLVLLVDADADFIAATKQMLIANKYEVMTARDGEEGLNKAMREEPDIILLDVILPGKDGYSVFY
jgi:DNA-binding response OmpR family regulator